MVKPLIKSRSTECLCLAWTAHKMGSLREDLKPELRSLWESMEFADGYAIHGLSGEEVLALGAVLGVQFVNKT